MIMNKKILFLDLEDTVIDDFSNMNLKNIEKVKSWIKKECFDEVRLFSFAIHYDACIKKFNTYLKHVLEDQLEIKINDDIFCTYYQYRAIGKYYMEYIEHDELFDVIGKKRAFIAWCNINYSGNHCVLLDDAFKDETIIQYNNFTLIDFVLIKDGIDIRNVNNVSQYIESGFNL